MIADPIADGLARGWRVIDASALDDSREFECDVCIVGSGAGGGIAAEILAAAGLSVILVEEGPLKSSRDFAMREADAYPQLYQESAARKTRDKAINILQGRCVGGSTTVNWTSSFRTPVATLGYWEHRMGLGSYTPGELRPWFERIEQRLSIGPWDVPPNANNDVLGRGLKAVGIDSGIVRRNVKGCWNIGYCGLGCPTNAKQSMLVTSIPAALDRGATLLVNADARRLDGINVAGGSRAAALAVRASRPGTGAPPDRIVARVHARHFVLAAGAIGSPALLLRSRAPDPYALLGRRTFLHPTVISAAVMEGRVDAYAGAPQSVYSDHFLDTQAIDGPIGFKLEAAPAHPVIFATTMAGFGSTHTAMMREFNRTNVLLALLRDGFHPDSSGGTVSLRDDGSPVLDYALTPFIFDGIRRAFLAMAEIQFAAGARQVIAVHEDARLWSTWADAKRDIATLDLRPLSTRIVSAHVMGGCPMNGDARRGVVDESGRHHHVANISVLDGSLFPTSLGANPQLSIYAIVARLATRLASELSRRTPASST